MSRLQANFSLLVVTLLWSTEVILYAVVPADEPTWATTCTTSLVGAILLWLCFGKRIAQSFKKDRILLYKRLGLLSVLNVAYNVLAITGLNYFDVSAGAFTLTMSVVVLPVLLLTMHRNVPTRTWISALIVLAGMLIAILPTFTQGQVPAFLIMTLSCICRAVYIVKLNDYAREHDPIALSGGICAFNAIISFIPWVIIEPATFFALDYSAPVVASLFIHAYFVMAFATVLNIFAQRRATPSESTIIYSTEIIFSIIWAMLLPDNIIDPVPLTLSSILGCLLIVAGNLVEIIRIKRKAKPQEEQEEQKTPKAVSGEHEIDMINKLLGLFKKPLVRALVMFAVLLALYLALAMPFKVLTLIPGFTDIRPVNMLQPVYGIFFGLPGCFACAFGNLIGDILSDGLRISSVAGFIANFLFPYLMYVIWVKKNKEPFEIQSMRNLWKFIGTIVALAVLQALIITPAVVAFYPDVDFVLFGLSVVGNGAVFPIILTIPFIGLFQNELGFGVYKPSNRFESNKS